MAFENVTMTKEERDWERTLGIKDQYFNYKHNIEGRPKGSDMTVDRERGIYLFGIKSNQGLREPETENTIHFFMLLWNSGRLYFCANNVCNYDSKEVIWYIREVDLIENETGLSKNELIDYIIESINEYGEKGIAWKYKTNITIYKGIAVFDEAKFNGKWITE